MRSTKRSLSAQALSQVPLLTPHYIITSGAELVDVGTTLIFVEAIALEYVRLIGEDVTIWSIPAEGPPVLRCFIRPLVNGGAELHRV